MSQPPRLKTIHLPWEQTIVYFVTLCVHHREPRLDNPEVFAAIKTSIAQIKRWTFIAGVVMPDHFHALVTPVFDRELSVGDFSTGFKKLLKKQLPHSWEWQRGCFDRLLRSDESAQNKWHYIRENPVRHGYVNQWHEWPYHINITGD
ncbi:MAG: hypothetical protein WCD79_23620 [Chthoniobacteraceae bacterium]